MRAFSIIMMKNSLLLEISGIRKTFPGVIALDDVSFTVAEGEIHTLLGENGAGKSTLMNVLTGLYHPDRGSITVGGVHTHFTCPADSLKMGIGMVHQHFMLVPSHTVFENILLAMENLPLFLNLKQLKKQVAEVISRFGIELDLDTPVWKLSIGAQQWIELIKLLMRDCRVLILDEPTAVLTPQEADKLFAVLLKLKEAGKSIIFISHKMREVMAISDRVTILKKGRSITTLNRGDFDEAKLASLMIGDDRIPEWEKSSAATSEVLLEIQHLAVKNDRGLSDLTDFSLTLHKGEILGIAGIAGNGQKALAETLTGLKDATHGSISVRGEDITYSNARHTYIAGIAHIPEDRKAIGIAPDMSVDENLIMKSYKNPEFRKGIFQDKKAIAQNAQDKIGTFAIKAGPAGTPVKNLSGGNIQKVIIARELSESPAVLVALYPTRGLDIGSAEYVHKVIADSAREGMSTILISEDLDELLKLSDRIVVMFRGNTVGSVDPKNTTREEIGLMMAGEVRA